HCTRSPRHLHSFPTRRSSDLKPLEEYLPNKLHQQIAKEALTTTGLADSFDVIARVTGGGMTGQAGALRLGVARALNNVDVEANRSEERRVGKGGGPRRAARRG